MEPFAVQPPAKPLRTSTFLFYFLVPVRVDRLKPRKPSLFYFGRQLTPPARSSRAEFLFQGHDTGAFLAQHPRLGPQVCLVSRNSRGAGTRRQLRATSGSISHEVLSQFKDISSPTPDHLCHPTPVQPPGVKPQLASAPDVSPCNR